jgi:hypothetical protein
MSSAFTASTIVLLNAVIISVIKYLEKLMTGCEKIFASSHFGIRTQYSSNNTTRLSIIVVIRVTAQLAVVVVVVIRERRGGNGAQIFELFVNFSCPRSYFRFTIQYARRSCKRR